MCVTKRLPVRLVTLATLAIAVCAGIAPDGARESQQIRVFHYSVAVKHPFTDGTKITSCTKNLFPGKRCIQTNHFLYVLV